MRVLVSGSSGLIGGAVVERPSAEGDEVVCFDIANGRVLDSDSYATTAQGCDAIVHAVGEHRSVVSDPVDRFTTRTTLREIGAYRKPPAGQASVES